MSAKEPFGKWFARTTGDHVSSALQSFLFAVAIFGALVGTIALFAYFRNEGVLVPALVSLGGAAVLLLLGYLVWRPLVRFGYLLVWLAIWLALTSLVLRLFSFGAFIGVVGTGIWFVVSVGLTAAYYLAPEPPKAEVERQQAKWENFFGVQRDESGGPPGS